MIQPHTFEFIDVEARLEFLSSDPTLDDYQVVVDGTVTASRLDLMELSPEMLEQADQEAKEWWLLNVKGVQDSQNEDFKAWRRS